MHRRLHLACLSICVPPIPDPGQGGDGGLLGHRAPGPRGDSLLFGETLPLCSLLSLPPLGRERLVEGVGGLISSRSQAAGRGGGGGAQIGLTFPTIDLLSGRGTSWLA